jgi:hypothetical protein
MNLIVPLDGVRVNPGMDWHQGKRNKIGGWLISNQNLS